MKKLYYKALLFLTTSLLILIILPHSLSAADKKILKVPYYDQGNDGYCWAACFAMLINYHKQQQDFIKPWNVVDYFDLGRNKSLYLWGKEEKIKEYLSSQTGAGAAVIQSWRSWHYDHLKQYLIEQIVEKQEPVFLGFTGAASAQHAVIVVGYENNDGKDIFYVHDPDSESTTGIQKTWDALRSNLGLLSSPTIAISGGHTDAASKPVTVNVLPPERSTQTVQFKSPLDGNLPDQASSASVVFNWYDQETTEYGFMSNGGEDGMSVKEIPGYYTMLLHVIAANADELEGQFTLTYTLANKSSPGISASGHENIKLAAGALLTVRFMLADLKQFTGACELKVSIADAGTATVYDQFAIDISFGQGIQLSALQEYDAVLKKKVAKLSWKMITGDFNAYVIYKRTAQSMTWEATFFLPASVSEYTDTRYDDKQQTDYAVAAVKIPLQKYFITSDVVSLSPYTSTTTTTALTNTTTTTTAGGSLVDKCNALNLVTVTQESDMTNTENDCYAYYLIMYPYDEEETLVLLIHRIFTTVGPYANKSDYWETHTLCWTGESICAAGSYAGCEYRAKKDGNVYREDSTEFMVIRKTTECQPFIQDPDKSGMPTQKMTECPCLSR